MQLAAPKPAAPKPAPEPEELAQSEELTQALRAFAPLSPTPVALKAAPVAAAEGQEVARETPVFDAPELPSIAPAQLPEPDVQAPPVAEPAHESALAAFIEPPPAPVETPDETTIGSLSLPPVLESPEPDELQHASPASGASTPQPSAAGGEEAAPSVPTATGWSQEAPDDAVEPRFAAFLAPSKATPPAQAVKPAPTVLGLLDLADASIATDEGRPPAPVATAPLAARGYGGLVADSRKPGTPPPPFADGPGRDGRSALSS